MSYQKVVLTEDFSDLTKTAFAPKGKICKIISSNKGLRGVIFDDVTNIISNDVSGCIITGIPYNILQEI